MTIGVVVAFGGCTRREPPTPDVSPSVAVPELPVPSGSAATSLPAPSAVARDGASAPAREAALSAPAREALSPPAKEASSAHARSASPALVGEVDDAGPSQTHQMPESGPEFAQRSGALWQAIVHDQPERAMSFFFPLAAYEQVKDVGDPAADWKRRLAAAYARDIHALHAELGDAAAAAHFISLDVPAGRARWVEPGEEWNKLGYFRVFGSKLRYEVSGETHEFDVKSLISWRGEWYVVHLSRIK